jgi:hypothetical protein
MRFWTVDVSQIIGAVDRAKFANEDIERMAMHILAVGGLVRPLVLEKVGICQETYRDILRVVDGHLSYWAAVRAKELEPKGFEMVNAFVLISSLQVKGVVDQIEFIDLATGCSADEDETLTIENARLLVERSVAVLTQATNALSALI